MSLIGKIFEDRATKAHYVVYHTNGNNPPVPTHIKCAYLFCIDGPKWLGPPVQKYVTVPLDFLNRFFTDQLSRTPKKYDTSVLVPVK